MCALFLLSVNGVGAVSRRVVWATATANGRNCAAACRGFNGGSNKPYVALNVGSKYAPAFLCRASVRPCPRQSCWPILQKFLALSMPPSVPPLSCSSVPECCPISQTGPVVRRQQAGGLQHQQQGQG